MTDTALSQLQLSRAEALDRARSILVPRTFVSTGQVEFPYQATGLARFILDGVDLFNTEDSATEETAAAVAE